ARLCADLADALEQHGALALSLAWTSRWVALTPGDAGASGELLRRASACRGVEHLEAAVGRVMGRPAPLAELAGRLAEAIVTLGEIDAERGRMAARRAIDVFGPKSFDLRNAALELAERDGDHELAIATLERW